MMAQEHDQASSLVDARRLRNDLRSLGQTTAPRTVAESALARVGLADWFSSVETPLGLVYFSWNDTGLSFATREDDETVFREAARTSHGRALALAEPPEWLANAARAWLAGDDQAPLSFDLARLTPFERAVLMKTREIPHGEVRPYGWIAREIGNPRAVRAVGTALAHNPTPVFIPCHRVVRSDGQLGAYSMGGQQAKRTILRAEGVNLSRLESLASGGLRYVGSVSGDYYCYPTCHGVRDLGPDDLVAFRDETSARAAGRRPCETCRPPVALLAG